MNKKAETGTPTQSPQRLIAEGVVFTVLFCAVNYFRVFGWSLIDESQKFKLMSTFTSSALICGVALIAIHVGMGRAQRGFWVGGPALGFAAIFLFLAYKSYQG
ncbi:MAG: hypothetical protein ACYTDT_00200 [Planctomycetota bacterium]|jgi:hypothetical protein